MSDIIDIIYCRLEEGGQIYRAEVVDRLCKRAIELRLMEANYEQRLLDLSIANTHLELANTRIAELEQLHRWIPFETMPNKEGHYIVHVTNKSHHFGDWETRDVYECVYSETGWHTANKVTHWQPLPEPPEGSI